MPQKKQVAAGREDDAETTDETAPEEVIGTGSPTGGHAVFVADLDGSVNYVSQSCEEFFGIAAETIVGSSMDQYLPVTQGSEPVEAIIEQLQRGNPLSRELTVTTAGGERRSVVFEATPVGCGEGGTIVGTYVDRTEQQRVEAKQRLLTEVSQLIGEADSYLSGLENAIRAICTHTEWIYGELWTPADNGDVLEFTLGYTEDQIAEGFLTESETRSFDYGEGLPGRVYDSQTPEWIPDASEEPRHVFHRAELAAAADLQAAFGVPVIAEGRVLSVIVFFLCERRETDDRLASDVSDVVGSLGDLIERKQAEDLRRQQNEQLDGFACEVAHDLRNPLSVAQGYLAIAADEPDPEPSLGKVSDALDRMEELIENLLRLSHDGKTIGEETAVSLEEIASAAWANVPTTSATIDITPGRLEADPTRVQQLFENLFRNSVQHAGSDAAVRVGPLYPVLTSTRPDETRYSTGFYVEDNGPGIPAAERESVFETSYSTGGTGLGLVTVKEIATAHGWSVSCTESQAGGARFEFTETDVSETTENYRSEPSS